MSAEAITATEDAFDQIARELHTQAGKQLLGREDRWRFERRQGNVGGSAGRGGREHHDGRPDSNVAIVVGSSSQAMHRVLGSVAVSLARHARAPLLIVP